MDKGTLPSAPKKPKHTQVASVSHSNSSSMVGSTDGTNSLKSRTISDSTESMNMDGSSSDLSYHDDGDHEDGDNFANDLNYYSDDDLDLYDDYDDYDDFPSIDEYSLLQSNFDNVDLPPGVEASIPLLTGPWGKSILESKSLTNSDVSKTETKGIASSLTVDAVSGSSSNKVEVKNNESTMGTFQFKKFDVVDDLSGSCSNKVEVKNNESTMETFQFKKFDVVNDLSGSSSNKVEVKNNESTMETFQFEKFDVVDDFQDHHYAECGFSKTKPPKKWAKIVQEEWKILENNLPDTIFVRVYESRMELLRAVILGPSGTPYHDGLFVFDCLFPENYPNSPPSVYYYSGGLRLNPNLYSCGKVCLSLLGTWSGKKDENWVPGKSTMLQVLVSIQALILNSSPFFNEPGYERYTGAQGQKESKKYNEDVFILSLKTMIYTLRRPPKHFEELVVQHFRCRAHDILAACEAYTKGALVGSNNKDRANNQDDKNSGSATFKSAVSGMMNMLVTSFSQNGAPGCEEFRPPAKN